MHVLHYKMHAKRSAESASVLNCLLGSVAFRSPARADLAYRIAGPRIGVFRPTNVTRALMGG